MSARKEPAPIIIQTPPEQPPPPKDFSQATQTPLRDDSGESTGTGTANRSTPGERQMEAIRGLNQANLSRSAKTDESDSKLDEAATPAPAESFANAGSSAPAPDIGVTQPQPMPPADPVREVIGHSSRASDTDSFASLANSNNVRFHDGKMDARQGRKVKTTRPDYGLAAMSDAQALVDTSMTFGVTVDAAGNVTDVVVLHSSGSQNIDEPTKRALYSWWFEPKKDKDGHPLPDLWVVRID